MGGGEKQIKGYSRRGSSGEKGGEVHKSGSRRVPNLSVEGWSTINSEVPNSEISPATTPFFPLKLRLDPSPVGDVIFAETATKAKPERNSRGDSESQSRRQQR